MAVGCGQMKTGSLVHAIDCRRRRNLGHFRQLQTDQQTGDELARGISAILNISYDYLGI